MPLAGAAMVIGALAQIFGAGVLAKRRAVAR
jgi:hypothetical protein